MTTNALSLEQIREKTKEALGRESLDMSYITQEMIDRDASLGASGDPGINTAGLTDDLFYGHNVRYGTVTGSDGQNYSCYYCEYGNGSQDTACSNDNTTWIGFDWHHNYLGQCGDGSEMWEFSK